MLISKDLRGRIALLALLIPFLGHAGTPTSHPTAEARQAYMMRLSDNWEIDGDLPTQALLISLQGLANQGAPRLYFIYPKNWPYTFTEALFEYYGKRHNLSFTELKTAEEALDALGKQAQGYVVWDKKVRTSLIVAFTVAGLERAVVVTEEQIPLVERSGLKKVEDFRGRFTGQSDYEIYRWAYEQYWDRTSKDFLIYLGGVGGNRMQPGIADFGIYQKAFFTDLSADPQDTLEYRLANKLMSEMNPMALVMGWHSYAKDTEDQHVTLVSSHGLRMEGLNTLPNMSFNTQIPTTPGYRFTNNHNVKPAVPVSPEEKVYIACIQTDALGIGAWLKPGRGQIPYSWEVTMNWVWLAPAMLQYFYDSATPNDYFIGSLSGPGYLYPKAVPRKLLSGLIAKARELMQQLDLKVFETMDYSEGNRYRGNIDLPKQIVDAYYQGMPEALGFINGYGPAHTYDIRDGRPFLSYDYYLSPNRPAEDAVADLQELAQMNPKRPYFLVMHVRESSDIKRVKGILDQLGPEFEVVPLDLFLQMAGRRPTFKVRYLRE
jgi:hypothetical protein